MNKSIIRLIKQFLPSIVLGFGFLAFILIVKPSFIVLLCIIFVLSFAVNVYLSLPVDKVLIGSAKNTIIAALIIGLFKWIGSKGLIYGFLAVVLAGLIILFRRWKTYVKTLGDIEEEFFGRRFR